MLASVWSSLLKVKMDVFGMPFVTDQLLHERCMARSQGLTGVKLLLDFLLAIRQKERFETV